MFDGIYQFIKSWDRREFLLYVGLYLLFCMVGVGIIFVHHVYLLRDMQDKVKQLNNGRLSVQEVLTKYHAVEKQKEKVDALLKQDKTFYFQKYFQDLAQKVGIVHQVTSKLSTQKLQNGYTEENLQVTLAQIDTKQLCELLQHIENEQRVYTKSVDITKVVHTKKINVNMALATLQAKSE